MTNYDYDQDERTDEYMSLLREIKRMARRIERELETGGPADRVSDFRLELARGTYYRMDDVMEYMRDYLRADAPARNAP